MHFMHVKSIIRCMLYDGFHISVHALLNLLNKLRKATRGLSSILSSFRNKINKLNCTGARMPESLVHMTLRLLSFALLMEILSFAVFCYSRHFKVLLMIKFISFIDATSRNKRINAYFASYNLANHIRNTIYITYNYMYYDINRYNYMTVY